MTINSQCGWINRHKKLRKVGFLSEIIWVDLTHWLDLARSNPGHWSFRVGMRRPKGGKSALGDSFFTWDLWGRGEGRTILRRRGFALLGVWAKTLESLRETLGACGLHGEFIHGAIAILSSSGAFAWRRAHLERRAHLISSDAHQERKSCQIQLRSDAWGD